MTREDINQMLQSIIIEAGALGLPVSKRISENVYINPRPKRRFGCCKNTGGNYVIELSEFVLECPEKAIMGVLAHEVLHTCRGAYQHGEKWKEYADAMNRAYGYNIKRTNSYTEMGLQEPEREIRVNYIIRCTECGREYPRQRMTKMMKNIRNYRCRCGGKLEIVKYSK